MISVPSNFTPSNPYKVILRAPLLTQSGYGVHARQVARWLFDKADASGGAIQVVTEPVSWGNTPWIVNQEYENGLVRRIIESAVRAENQHYDLSLQLQLPNEWNPFLADKNVGLSAVVEATICNPDWIEACNRMDLVVVPSEFAKNILSRPTLVTPIMVVPESYFDEAAQPLDENAIKTVDDKLQGVTTPTNFLIFGQITANNLEADRKYLGYALRYLCEKFAGNPNVGILIKTNMGRNSKVDRSQTTQVIGQILLQVEELVKASSKTAKLKLPPVHLIHGDLTNAEVAALYKNPKVTAMVSLTRGEGFGLPLLEAAASGLPVIATDWSAHTEFLNLGKWIKVDNKLTQIPPARVDQNIWMKDAQWATPLEEDFKKKLGKFIDSPAAPKSWASDLQKKIVERYSFSSVSSKYDVVLEKFLTEK